MTSSDPLACKQYTMDQRWANRAFSIQVKSSYGMHKK